MMSSASQASPTQSVAGGAEDDVDRITVGAGEMVLFEEAIVLHVTDDRRADSPI